MATMSTGPNTGHQDLDIEIRHLPHSVIQQLSFMLDTGHNWKRVMAAVNLDCDPNKDLKYGVTHINAIADYVLNSQDDSCTAKFLDEWGTSGRRRPKVSDLVRYLEEECLKQAATYLRQDILKQTISDDDAETRKWLEEELKAKDMEEKRQREKVDEERRKKETQEEARRAENLAKRLQHEDRERKDMAENVNNAKEVLQNGAFDSEKKACKHLKQTTLVGGNNGNQFLHKQENGKTLKADIVHVEVHRENGTNAFDVVAPREAIGGHKKQVCFHLKQTEAVGNATEIQGVLLRGSDVSNVADNNRIEEESSVLTETEVCSKPDEELRQSCSSKDSSKPSEELRQSCSGEDRFKPSEKLHQTCNGKDDFKLIAGLMEFSLSELERATNGFNEDPYTDRGGNKLGEGAYGGVYYGKLTNGTEVAVKTLRSETKMTSSTLDTEQGNPVTNLFSTEVRNLAVCKHPNLIRLLGYFVGEISCIVYEYMPNGSLYDRLACMNDTPPLRQATRCSIALGVAEALDYLHTGLPSSLVHRDVKSMNVLLNERLEAKLGDFGIVREMSEQEATMYTNCPEGTSPYMAPEAHHGCITEKSDVFAYGIVLLELLTGLKPSHNDGLLNDHSLWVHFVCEQETEEQGMKLVKQCLDVKANWDNATVVDALVEIAYRRCCLEDRKRRADMREIVGRLREMKF